jgi:hypothetical protein
MRPLGLRGLIREERNPFTEPFHLTLPGTGGSRVQGTFLLTRQGCRGEDRHQGMAARRKKTKGVNL